MDALPERLRGILDELSALGDRAEALRHLEQAATILPVDPEIAALRYRLGAVEAADWPPTGCDPVSARVLLGFATALDGDMGEAAALVEPLGESFPELAGIFGRP